jgi:hypothetical protein
LKEIESEIVSIEAKPDPFLAGILFILFLKSSDRHPKERKKKAKEKKVKFFFKQRTGQIYRLEQVIVSLFILLGTVHSKERKESAFNLVATSFGQVCSSMLVT